MGTGMRSTEESLRILGMLVDLQRPMLLCDDSQTCMYLRHYATQGTRDAALNLVVFLGGTQCLVTSICLHVAVLSVSVRI